MTISRRKGLHRLAATVCALAALLGLGASAAFAQTGPGVTKDEILLGSWSALTGPMTVYGLPGLAGQNAFYKRLNDMGGIKGRKIRVITEDHAYNAQRAVAAARKLIEGDQVLAIQGAFGSAATEATFPYVLGQAKVPFVLPYAGASSWYKGNDKNLLIGAMVPYDYHSLVLGRWAAKEGAKNILVIHASSKTFEDNALLIEPGAKGVNAQVKVTLMPVKMGTADWAPVALDIISRKPDAIVSIGSIPDLVALAKSMQQQNFKAPIYTYAGGVSNETIKLGGSAVDGVRAVSYTLPVDSDAPAVQEYRAALAKYEPQETPDFGSLMTYAQAKIMAEVLRVADEPLNRENLLKAFSKVQGFDTGILGTVSFGPDRRLGGTQLQRVEVRGGKWQTVGSFVDYDAAW